MKQMRTDVSSASVVEYFSEDDDDEEDDDEDDNIDGKFSTFLSSCDVILLPTLPAVQGKKRNSLLDFFNYFIQYNYSI